MSKKIFFDLIRNRQFKENLDIAIQNFRTIEIFSQYSNINIRTIKKWKSKRGGIDEPSPNNLVKLRSLALLLFGEPNANLLFTEKISETPKQIELLLQKAENEKPRFSDLENFILDRGLLCLGVAIKYVNYAGGLDKAIKYLHQIKNYGGIKTLEASIRKLRGGNV